MRILVAEDDPRLLKSLVHILKINNYSADGVSNGNDAFDYARTGEYDGLVLDIMMPGCDGIRVLKKLRAGDQDAGPLPECKDGDIPAGGRVGCRRR